MNPLDKVKEHLLEKEGVGDEVTNVETGEGGITAQTKLELEKEYGRKLTDKQARELYVDRAYNTYIEILTGFLSAPSSLQAYILDTGFNLGTRSIMSFSLFKRAMREGDWREAGRQLLDTANVDGKSLKGIAIRRAWWFNLLTFGEIISVEQEEDGTIIYHGGDGPILSYTPRNGRHPKSKPGVVQV